MSGEKTKSISKNLNVIDKTSKAKSHKVLSTVTSLITGMYKRVSNIFYPAYIKCIICGDDLKQKQQIEICDKCQCKLKFITEKECCKGCGAPLLSNQGSYCLNCKSGDREFDIGRSVFVYDGEIKNLIAGLKYNNKPYISRTLSQYLAKLYKELDWQADLIVPVPLTKARKKWRGYNQAELLAEGVSDVLGIPINTEALVKIKDTDSQASLTLQERRKNLQSSFKVLDKYAVRGKKILLIDDVMTTGSTANACTNALKKAHADKVFVLTIAHGKMEIPTQSNIKDVKKDIN